MPLYAVGKPQHTKTAPGALLAFVDIFSRLLQPRLHQGLCFEQQTAFLGANCFSAISRCMDLLS